MQIIATERRGVQSQLLKDLAKRMQLPATRVYEIVGIPKATAERKVAAGALVAGTGGQATLGIVKLLGIARGLSTIAQRKKRADSMLGSGWGSGLSGRSPRWAARSPPICSIRLPESTL